MNLLQNKTIYHETQFMEFSIEQLGYVIFNVF